MEGKTGITIRKSLEYHTRNKSVYLYTSTINKETNEIIESQFIKEANDEEKKGLKKINNGAYTSEANVMKIIREYNQDKLLMESEDKVKERQNFERYCKQLLKMEEKKGYQKIGGRIIYWENGIKATTPVIKIEPPKNKKSVSDKVI